MSRFATWLHPKEFADKYGEIHAMSTNGLNMVTSALTKYHYIYYDSKEGKYIVHPR